MTSLLRPNERVLSTLNADGSRRWLRPKPSRGRFWRARRAVAYFLIALFVALPYIRIGDKPAVLLDILHREFTLFGRTFLPTDTVLLAALLVGVFLTVFFVTALFGRVWCGWACPQTVYMEFVFRPIERLFEGEPGSTRRKPAGLKAVKYAVYVALSVFLAHTFLAYFVGVDELLLWVRQSPLLHPVPFVVMLATTGLMLFDFGFFREQVCIVACPYGRMQSVMLDRDSLIVSYDRGRGEPRGRVRRNSAGRADVALPVVAAPAARTADCVDCGKCVVTCPTGIDIRDGLQMECIGCAQCIDACDDVMRKLDRPVGLIRYSSANAMAGGRARVLRARVAIYAALLAVVTGVFVTLLVTASPVDIRILRGRGQPFTLRDDGVVVGTIQVKLTNRTDHERAYTVEAVSPASAKVRLDENPVEVKPGHLSAQTGLLEVARGDFDSRGVCDVQIRIRDGERFERTIRYRTLGPSGHAGQEARP
ncbi:MAG: cytochrome c oxidase accessory protein CcoG [Phycisphaeraceae bacterium]|nr:cytochrome c oxidase accessory protein CcoG [Phycisphaeraceae bacterium]